MEKATFAAGCFWGVEAAFRQVEGVTDAVSGYTGGTLDDPAYNDVCGGRTGHAEAVEVTFDPSAVSYEQLVDFFWTIHDPTTLNRQGPDIGTQYRSSIFTHGPEQAAIAEGSKAALEQSGRFSRPVVTEIAEASRFYPAEDYHQQYFAKRGIVAACHTR